MSVSDQVIDFYRNLFAARTDVYSRWTDAGWRPVRAEMTSEVVAAGLAKAGPAISGFFIAPGNTTHVAALDFDLEDGMELARRFVGHVARAGAPAYVEGSRRGAHVWLLLEQNTPVKQVRAALLHWCDAAGMPRDPERPHRLHPKIELRPATDQISDDGLGHALRLPMMPHPKTGIRHRLATADGELLGPKLSDILLALDTVPPAVIADAALRYKPVIDPKSIPSSYRSPRPAREDDGASASDILRQMWGALNAVPGRAIRCPAHDDTHPSLSILRDDKRAVCHAPSCVLHNDGRGRGTWELRTMAPNHE